MATLEEFKKSRVIRYARADVTYADAGTETRIFTLPAGARIISFVFHITTLFAGGAATAGVGIKGTATYFVTAVSLATAGQKTASTEATAAQAGHTTTAETDVYMTVASGATSGACHVECAFALDVERSIR